MRTYLMTTTARILRAPDESGGAPAAEPAAAPAEAAAVVEAPENQGAEPELAPAAAEAEAAPEPKPTRVPWQNKRIDTLTAQARAAEERATAADRARAEAEQRAAAYEALYGKPEAAAAPAPAETTFTAADVDRRAGEIAAANALNQRLEDIFEEGSKAHGDAWGRQVQAAGKAFGADLQKRPDFFQALAGLPNPTDVYLKLTGDLDHFAEVLAMPPVQFGMEMAKLSAAAVPKTPKPKPPSGAPAPIEPIDGGAGAEETDLAKVPMNEYAATREKQLAARREARGY